MGQIFFLGWPCTVPLSRNVIERVAEEGLGELILDHEYKISVSESSAAVGFRNQQGVTPSVQLDSALLICGGNKG